MDQSFETLLVEQPQPEILLVTLNRPAAANALNTQMGRDIHALFSRFLIDPTAFRCIVVTGAGEKAFCAGGDLKERNGMTEDAWRRQHVIFEQAYYAVMDCPIPVIAAVNGAAYGGGCEPRAGGRFHLRLEHRAVRADRDEPRHHSRRRRNAEPAARGRHEAREGADPQRDPVLRGGGDAVGDGQPRPAARRFLPQTLDMARRIASNAPIAVRQAKRAIGAGFETDLKTGLALEVEAYNRTVPTEDRREGVLAFNEKRKPRFEGR